MATPEALHILLIDDHALVRTGLRMMLESAWPDGHVTEAGSIGEATGAAYELGTAELPPQLIMLDIELPGLSGLAGLTVLRKRWPEARVMVLTSHTEAEVREQALVQGADGFLSKAESTPQMLASIQALLQGDKCFRCGRGIHANDQVEWILLQEALKDSITNEQANTCFCGPSERCTSVTCSNRTLQ